MNDKDTNISTPEPQQENIEKDVNPTQEDNTKKVETEPTENASKKKLPLKKILWFAIPTVLALGVALSQYLFYVNNPLMPVAIDSTDNVKNVEELCGQFVTAGFKCEVVEEYSSTVPAGNLIAQSLEEGYRVRVGTNVTLKYSIGEELFEVPDVSKLNEEDAVNKIKELGFIIDDVSTKSEKGVEAGRVVSISPEPGTKLPAGGEVSLVVSDGKVQVPNWKGKTKEYVEEDAKKRGIKVQYVEKERDGASGIVLSQNVKAKEYTSDVVKVTISKAIEVKTIKVPDVIGMTPEETETILISEGFRHIKSVKVKTSSVNEPTVTQIVPGVGQDAKSEDNIVVIVSIPEK